MKLKIVLLGMAILLFAGAAIGQILYGSLTGNISDASNAPIAGAKVEALNVGTGIVKEGVSDVRGIFMINDLQPGTYRVTISAQGFSTVIQEEVLVEANTERRVDTQLNVAQMNQKITVTAAMEVLQTDRTDVKNQINPTELTNLPLGNDRNFQSAYVLVPGAAPPFASHSFAGNPTQSLALYVSGGSDISNITLIDGSIDTNFWEQNLIAYVPPSEAIEAVNIVTSGFDAESGNAAGSVTNVTVKSGSNTLHGSAFEFNTISKLESRNYFYYGPVVNGVQQPAGSNPKLVLNQFGFSLGGPIKKNKLFFFGDWERYRESQFGTGVISIPTQAMVQGNFQGAIPSGYVCPAATTAAQGCIFDPTTGTKTDGSDRTPFANNTIPAAVISKASAGLAALIPQPNYGGAAAGAANNFQYAGDLIFNRDSVDVKINYLPSDKSTFFGRYSVEPTYVFDPQQLNTGGGSAGGNALGSVSQPGNAYGLTQNASLGGTYTFSPRLLFDANVGFTRPRYQATNTDVTTNYGPIITGTDGTCPLQCGIPNIGISSLSPLGNNAVSNPFLFRDNQYTFAANLSWIHGAHNFRFGGAIDRYDMNRFQGQLDYGVRGGFSFTGGVTSLKGGPSSNAYNSFADFLLGLPQGLGKDYVYLNPSTTREWEFAGYARDNWQVTKKLSINYGARWEYYPIPTVSHYGSANFNWLTDTAYLGGVGGVPSNAFMTTGPGQLEPRVGIAYRLTDKTVIRTGYGMSSDPYALNYMAWVYPAVISQQISGSSSYIPGGYLGPNTGPTGTWTGPTVPGGLAAGIPSFPFPNLSAGKFVLPSYLGTYGYPNNYRRGYAESWNLEVQRDLGHNWNLQLGYVGDHMVREAMFINFNAAPPGPTCSGTQTSVNGVPCGGNNGTPLELACGVSSPPSFCSPTASNPLGGNPSAMTINGPMTGGGYHALQTQLTRRVAGGQVGITYTYSKTIDNNDTEANSGATWSYYQVLHRNKARAGFDRPHNLELYAVYNSPFGKRQKWLTTGAGAAILGNWSVTPVLSRYSGTPFNVTTSGSSCNCPGNTQTADQVEPSYAILGGHGANSPYFDPLAFAAVTTARFGTSGRDIVRGPGFFNINLSLVRDFNLTERFKLQFRAEAYGLTNTPNFANPATTVSNATFSGGAVTKYGGYDIISGTAATDWSPYATADRQIRFAMLLRF
jgi:hypothetical protein